MVGKTGRTNKIKTIYLYFKFSGFNTLCYCSFLLKSLIFENFKGKIRGDDVCKVLNYLELKKIETILQ